MEDLFEDFNSLPEKEDSVDLAETLVPEDDYFEQPEEAPGVPTYGGLEETKWPTYEFPTKGGKTIVVYHEKMGTLWAIKFKEGGQLPRELKSKYTAEQDAVQAVKIYLARNQ